MFETDRLEAETSLAQMKRCQFVRDHRKCFAFLEGSMNCTLCLAGTFSNESSVYEGYSVGSSTCSVCPFGWTSFEGSSQCGHCDSWHFGPKCTPCSCARNRGTCSDGLLGSGICSCSDGFDGDFCEHEIECVFILPFRTSVCFITLLFRCGHFSVKSLFCLTAQNREIWLASAEQNRHDLPVATKSGGGDSSCQWRQMFKWCHARGDSYCNGDRGDRGDSW